MSHDARSSSVIADHIVRGSASPLTLFYLVVRVLDISIKVGREESCATDRGTHIESGCGTT